MSGGKSYRIALKSQWSFFFRMSTKWILHLNSDLLNLLLSPYLISRVWSTLVWFPRHVGMFRCLFVPNFRTVSRQSTEHAGAASSGMLIQWGFSWKLECHTMNLRTRGISAWWQRFLDLAPEVMPNGSLSIYIYTYYIHIYICSETMILCPDTRV